MKTALLTIAVVLSGLLALRRTPRPQLRPLRDMPWWGWLGGAAAATYHESFLSIGFGASSLGSRRHFPSLGRSRCVAAQALLV